MKKHLLTEKHAEIFCKYFVCKCSMLEDASRQICDLLSLTSAGVGCACACTTAYTYSPIHMHTFYMPTCLKKCVAIFSVNSFPNNLIEKVFTSFMKYKSVNASLISWGALFQSERAVTKNANLISLGMGILISF